MTKEKFYVSEVIVDYAIDINATVFDNLYTVCITEDEFKDYVDVKKDDDNYYCLTVNLEFDEDINRDYYYPITNNTERFKLMTSKEYSKLKKALKLFGSVTIEFYIDTSKGDEEFSLRIEF